MAVSLSCHTTGGVPTDQFTTKKTAAPTFDGDSEPLPSVAVLTPPTASYSTVISPVYAISGPSSSRQHALTSKVSQGWSKLTKEVETKGQCQGCPSKECQHLTEAEVVRLVCAASHGDDLTAQVNDAAQKNPSGEKCRRYSYITYRLVLLLRDSGIPGS
jgi:hypothetical protein